MAVYGPELSLQLTAHDERLEVRANAQEGEAHSEVALPDRSLYVAVAQVRPGDAGEATLQGAGKQLYACVTAGECGQLMDAVLRDAERCSQPVHLELRFDPDQAGLARLPWELLTDPLGRALVRDGLANVTRYITYPRPPPDITPDYQTAPLLQVIAQPRGLPETSPAPLPIEHVLTLNHATFEDLERVLLVERVAAWGLHFHGHGAVSVVCQCGADLGAAAILAHPEARCPRCSASVAQARLAGVLAFEDGGDPRFVTTEELGAVLYNSRASLAMLLACESAAVGGKTIFSGLAPGLLLAGVPAVIGMQYEVSSALANHFAASFYPALLREGDILAAMYAARRLVREDGWYSPVLYLRRQASTIKPEPIYRTRHIDTATPAQVQADEPFLARLWIRRPETSPLSDGQLREELGLAPQAPLSTRSAAAEVRFESVEGRKLRCGDVEVNLTALGAEVEPDATRLFVNDGVDAPPAIFVVRPSRPKGTLQLIFKVFQDGGLIATAHHLIAISETPVPAGSTVSTQTAEIQTEDRPSLSEIEREHPEGGAEESVWRPPGGNQPPSDTDIPAPIPTIILSPMSPGGLDERAEPSTQPGRQLSPLAALLTGAIIGLVTLGPSILASIPQAAIPDPSRVSLWETVYWFTGALACTITGRALAAYVAWLALPLLYLLRGGDESYFLLLSAVDALVLAGIMSIGQSRRSYPKLVAACTAAFVAGRVVTHVMVGAPLALDWRLADAARFFGAVTAGWLLGMLVLWLGRLIGRAVQEHRRR